MHVYVLYHDFANKKGVILSNGSIQLDGMKSIKKETYLDSGFSVPIG